MSKSLIDIKRDIAIITLDIECLDPGSKRSAIAHLEETIILLKIGVEHETKLNDDSSDKEDTWMFNNDSFADDIKYESINGTFPLEEKDTSENESSIDHGNSEETGKAFDQIPNNEIKQEPVNQEPVVISSNPDTFHDQIASENANMLKCDPCDVYLPRSYTMQRHEEDPHHLARVATVKHKEDMSVDKSSEESLKQRPDLTENNSNPTTHICNICQKQYKSRGDLLQHKNVHTGKYKCQKCKETFDRRGRLERHNKNPVSCLKLKKVRASINVPPVQETLEKSRIENGMNEFIMRYEDFYQCPECPSHYSNKNSLAEHRVIHTGKYKCQQCNEPFSSRSRLELHNRNPNNCVNLKKIRASRDVTTNKSINIDTHRQIVNEESSQPDVSQNLFQWQCHECPNQYNNKKSVAEHRVIHTGKWQCHECPNQYNNTKSLAEHRVIHTGKYKCQQCNEPFASRCKLKKHNRNPNSCLNLKKIRASRDVTANESITHRQIFYEESSQHPELSQNTFQWQCPECPNQYNNKKSLMRHMHMHTGKFKCPRCEAPFIERSKLDIHTRDPESCRKLIKIRSSSKFSSGKPKLSHKWLKSQPKLSNVDLNPKTVKLS